MEITRMAVIVGHEGRVNGGSGGAAHAAQADSFHNEILSFETQPSLAKELNGKRICVTGGTGSFGNS